MIRPSYTRFGQRVDNPPLENSDTARLRVLLQDETQDDWHQQREFNVEVEKRLSVIHEWRSYLDKAGVADQRDIAMLWKALGVVTTILLLGLAAALRRLL